VLIYPRDLGFSSHPYYKYDRGIFGDIDLSFCPIKYTYGKDGKPFYIRGPYESLNDAKRIIDKLGNTCGVDNFEYMVMMNE
jgi:hypothetical protein